MSKLNLKIPPVAQGLLALLLMLLSERYVPIYRVDFRFKSIFAAAFLILGMVVGASAVLTFIKMRTTVDPRYPNKASRLVITGVYRISRNPMYLAILLVLLGVAVHLGALSAGCVVIAFGAYIHHHQILPEERVLRHKFGESYARYSKEVRRWL